MSWNKGNNSNNFLDQLSKLVVLLAQINLESKTKEVEQRLNVIENQLREKRKKESSNK